MTGSNTHFKKSDIWYFLCMQMCMCVPVCVCIYTVPAHVLSALPAAPAGVVHRTSLRTDPPRVVSLSKQKRITISLLTASTKIKS